MSRLLVVLGPVFYQGYRCSYRRALFALGALGALGAFQGKLNPLTGKSIYETCVIPVLLYGCENWILTDANIVALESFQGEIGRRILKLSKSHSLLATRLALQCQSIVLCILSRKLCLLSRVSSENDSVGCKIFYTLTPAISLLCGSVCPSRIKLGSKA